MTPMQWLLAGYLAGVAWMFGWLSCLALTEESAPELPLTWLSFVIGALLGPLLMPVVLATSVRRRRNDTSLKRKS